MKNIVLFRLSVASLTLLLGGCNKENSASPNQTCADEHVLEVYQDQEAKVVLTQTDKYCLTVSPSDFALNAGGYNPANILVPVSNDDIPTQYRIEGTHVLLSGRKKSCYGLTNHAAMFGSFGYKLEVDAIKASH
jgi:hypothetical protein